MADASRQLEIRRAGLADVDIVTEFNSRLAHETEGKSLHAAVLRAGVAAVLADPAKGVYFLACDGTEIVGQAMLTYEWSDWRNGWFWWFQSVYVRADYRGRGTFRQLFDHVCAAAREQGDVIGLRLYVEKHNTVAQAVYAKLGLEHTPYLILEKCPLKSP